MGIIPCAFVECTFSADFNCVGSSGNWLPVCAGHARYIKKIRKESRYLTKGGKC